MYLSIFLSLSLSLSIYIYHDIKYWNCLWMITALGIINACITQNKHYSHFNTDKFLFFIRNLNIYLREYELNSSLTVKDNFYFPRVECPYKNKALSSLNLLNQCYTREIRHLLRNFRNLTLIDLCFYLLFWMINLLGILCVYYHFITEFAKYKRQA